MKYLISFFLLFSSLYGEVIITATGLGQDLTSAKKDALISLSSTLFSEVKSSMRIENLRENNSGYNFSLRLVDIKSDMIFQKIEYKILKKSPYYKVKAIFSRESLILSIQNLIAQTDIDYSLIKSNNKFDEQERYLKMLSTLYPFIVRKSQRVEVKDYINKKFDMLYKVKNQGYVLIYLNNTNPDDFVIKINNRVYPTNSKIYLADGIYSYTITGKNYFTKKHSFKINKRSKLLFNITMFKKHNLKFNFLSNNSKYDENIKSIFDKNNLFLSNGNKNNYFKSTIKVFTNDKKIYGTVVYKVDFYLECYIDNKLILRKKFSKKNILNHLIPNFLEKSTEEFISGVYLNM